MDKKNCILCGKEFNRIPRRSNFWWKTAKFCTLKCSWKNHIGKPSGMLGKHLTEEQKAERRAYKHTKETKIIIGLASKGNQYRKGAKQTEEWKELMRKRMSGSNNHNWIFDRTKLVKKQERNDYAYKEWRRLVWSRDGFKCKIGNQDCYGRIETHHILNFRDYPELRYEINNGITLCHAHHPRKRVEEAKLIPTFQGIISAIAN
mgnify:CR=1 FL=1